MAEKIKEPTQDEKVLIYYDYLRGLIENIQIGNLVFGKSPKLSDKKAFNVLYYAQEFLKAIPDKFEKCKRCGKIFDTETEGNHIDEFEIKENKQFKKCDLGNFYCDHCERRIFYYQDREKDRLPSIGNVHIFEVKTEEGRLTLTLSG